MLYRFEQLTTFALGMIFFLLVASSASADEELSPGLLKVSEIRQLKVVVSECVLGPQGALYSQNQLLLSDSTSICDIRLSDPSDNTFDDNDSSVSGVPGETGAQGETGDVGATGPTGKSGERGATGAQGLTGSQGATGAQGLVGPQGATGAQGLTGETGPAGPQGATGPQGSRGETGPAGSISGFTEVGFCFNASGQFMSLEPCGNNESKKIFLMKNTN